MPFWRSWLKLDRYFWPSIRRHSSKSDSFQRRPLPHPATTTRKGGAKINFMVHICGAIKWREQRLRPKPVCALTSPVRSHMHVQVARGGRRRGKIDVILHVWPPFCRHRQVRTLRGIRNHRAMAVLSSGFNPGTVISDVAE